MGKRIRRRNALPAGIYGTTSKKNRRKPVDAEIHRHGIGDGIQDEHRYQRVISNNLQIQKGYK